MKQRVLFLFLNIILILSLIAPGNMVTAAENQSVDIDQLNISLGTTESDSSTETYIIKYKNTMKGNEALSKRGIRSEKALEHSASIVTTQLTKADVEQLRKDPNIAYIEKDSIVRKAADTVTDNAYQIHVPEVHAQGNIGQDVKVAVLDTGLDRESPELNIAGEISFVPSESPDDLNGHGTVIGGIIGALKDGQGLIGVAPGVSLYNVKVLNEFGIGSYSQVIQGIEWAIENKMDIISMSFTGEEYSMALEEALQNAYNNGILLVAAVGNEGINSISYPARYSSVIGVGAVDGSNQRATFSNMGQEVELVAPGVSIQGLSNDDSNSYTSMSGTSMAVPQVAGVAALIKSKNPSWSNDEIRQVLQSSAVNLGDPLVYGHGLINAANALQIENVSYTNNGEYNQESEARTLKMHMGRSEFGTGTTPGSLDTVTESIYGTEEITVTDAVYHVAAAEVSYPKTYDQVALNNVNLKPDQAPFSIQNGNESISTLSGSLSLQNAELTLPGRNGMGFTLSRSYDSSDAQLYDMDVEAKDIFYVRSNPYHYLTYDRKSSNGTIYYAIDSALYNAVIQGFYPPEPGQIAGKPKPLYKYFTDNYYLYYWGDSYVYDYLSIDQIGDFQTSALDRWRGEFQNNNQFIYYSDFFGPSSAGNYYREWSALASPDIYAPLIDMTYMYTGYFNKNIEKTYSDSQFPIGKGWSWNISSIEFKKGKKYLHLANKGVYEINGSNQLVGYPWKDLTLSSNSSVLVNGQNSVYDLKFLNNQHYYFNNEGKLLRMADGYGNNLDFTYNSVNPYGNVLTGITDALGNTISITYTTTNVTLTLGDQTVVYNKQSLYGKEFLSSVVDQMGRKTSYDYGKYEAKFNLPSNTTANQPISNPYGLLKTVIYPTSAVTKFEYETSPVARQIGPSGTNQAYRVSKRYDQVGQSKSNQVSFSYPGDMGSSYSGSYQFTTVVDNGLTQTTYTNSKQYINDTTPAAYYNVSVVEQDKSTAAKQTINKTYDTTRRLPVPNITTIQSSNATASSSNKTTALVYDDYGNVISHTDPLGTTTTYTTDSNHYINSELIPIDNGLSRYTEMIRDPKNGQTLKWTIRDNNANGTIRQQIEYSNLDQFGNPQTIIQKDDNRDILVNFEYSENYGRSFPTAQSIQVTDIDGSNSIIRQTATYDKTTGRVLSFTDSNNQTTSYSYDKLGRILKAIFPDQSERSLNYDDVNNILSSKDETGVELYTRWNPLGLKIEEGYKGISTGAPYYNLNGDLYSVQNAYNYDIYSRRDWSKDALSQQTSFSYDSWGRIIRTIFADEAISSVEYDDIAQTVSTQEPGVTYKVIQQLDLIGRLLESRELGTKTNERHGLIYNLAGQVKQKRDYPQPGVEQVTSYSYDVMGRLTSVTQPTNPSETTGYTYSLSGSLKNINLADGSVISYFTDEVGRRIGRIEPGSALEKTYYDGNNNIVKSTDKKGVSFNYIYNNRNLLTSRVSPDETVSYSYDKAGRRLSMTDPTGTNKYGYKSGTGQLIKITYPDSKTMTYTYNKIGLRATMKDPFGYTQNYTYDNRNRLKGIGASSANPDVGYTYYANNQLKTITRSNGPISSFSYDGPRLDTLSNGNNAPNYDYSYDGNSNIIGVKEDESSKTYSYDELNRVKEASQYNEAYSYDKLGNRITLDTDQIQLLNEASYQYDSHNRLIQANTVEGKSVAYSYNGDGLLVSRTENGEVTRYYYDGSVIAAEGKVIAGNVNLTSRYLYGADGVSYMQTGGVNYYYLKNGHGDVTGLSKDAGTLVNQYSYDLWGNPTFTKESIKNPFLYSGEYWDSSTKLQYLRARWYDPGTGRFISKDTYEGDITNPLSLNLYAYVKNNPLMYVDPSGHREAYGYLGEGDDPRLTYAGTMLDSNGYYVGEARTDMHTLLDLIGLIPVVGEAADAINAIYYLAEGDYAYALLSSGSMVPIAGWASTGTKAVVRVAENTVDADNIKAAATLMKSVCNCFVGGTQVQTDEGEKDIEDIEVGDKVLAKDEETGEQAYKEVEWLFQRDVEETYNITVGGEVITTTDEHPFWIVGKGWVKSKDLVVGEVLTTSDGKVLAIEKIDVKEEHKTVYNFMVKDFHTYFVSNLGIWTHNACKPINLPSYKNIEIDMDHIISGHTKGGSRATQSKIKDLFPDNMNNSQIEKAVRDAYSNSSKLQTQGDRVLVRGQSNGLTIEIWVNTSTKAIETAYPVFK